MQHNARSVVAAWRANPDTQFTGLYQQARPSSVNYRVAITLRLLADEATRLRQGLIDDGFPAHHSLIDYLNDAISTATARAEASHQWATALTQAERETE